MQICSNVLNSKISKPETKKNDQFVRTKREIEIVRTSDVEDPNKVGFLHGGVLSGYKGCKTYIDRDIIETL